MSGHNGSPEPRAQRSEEPRRRPPDGDRGQTTLDFAIGVSIFLAVLLFIFLFIPGTLSPFTASAQDERLTSNRVADQLAVGTLASPEQPYVLDSYCTVSFFKDETANCQFSGDSLEAQLGLDARFQDVNVSLRGNLTAAGTGHDVVCWDGTANETGLVETSNDQCDTRLERGDPVPTSVSSVTSVRVVSLDGRDVALYVEVW